MEHAACKCRNKERRYYRNSGLSDVAAVVNARVSGLFTVENLIPQPIRLVTYVFSFQSLMSQHPALFASLSFILLPPCFLFTFALIFTQCTVLERQGAPSVWAYVDVLGYETSDICGLYSVLYNQPGWILLADPHITSPGPLIHTRDDLWEVKQASRKI